MINWFRNLHTGVKIAIIAGLILVLLSCCCISAAVLVVVINKPDIDILQDLGLSKEDILDQDEMENEHEEVGEEEEEESKVPKKTIKKKVIYLSWKFENFEGPPPENPQRTKVILVISGDLNKNVFIGTYDGTAWDMKKSGNWTPPTGALMAFASFWAGEANEIAVFKTSPHTLTIRHRQSFEEESDPGSFENIKKVDISVETVSGSVNPEVKVE